MGNFRRGTLVVALVVAVVLGAVLASALGDSDGDRKRLVVPTSWRAAWDVAHVLEGEDVALAWGDRAGEDPTAAATDLRFDPAVTLAQLEALHALDVGALGLGARDGDLATRKLLVVVDGSWTDGPGAGRDAPVDAAGGVASGAATDEPLTQGGVVGGVPLLRAAPSVLAAPGSVPAGQTGPTDSAGASDGSTSAPGGEARDGMDADEPVDLPQVPPGTSWELARGVAETVQHVTQAANPGHGLTPQAADTLRTAASAYLATLAVPDQFADVSEQVAAPHLAWGSARHGAAGWLLLAHLASRSSPSLVADLWNRSLDTEHVLGAYARLTASNAPALNRRIAQYAMRTAVADVAGTTPGSVLATLDPVLVAHRTTPVEAVADDPGRYLVTGTFAPAAYGYTVVRLLPDGSGSDVRVRVRGHVEVLADGYPGWSFGMVAVGPAGLRYTPVTEATDGELRLALRPGETEAYLVVTATPTQVVSSVPGDFPASVRYPYEFRVAGATVADPAAEEIAGGHRHPNGGGWVDDAAQVDPAAYVAAGAVVRGDAVVGPGVRLEGRAWVESGARLDGSVVVRDVAVVRAGAQLSGDVVVGGDAVVAFTCDAGTYTSYRADAHCDPAAVDGDVNLAVVPFAPGDLTVSDGPTTAPPEPTDPDDTATPGPDPAAPSTPATTPGSGAPSADPPPAQQPPVTTPPATGAPGVANPPAAVPGGACTATYELVNSWPGGFQAEVRVTATTSGVRGWSVSWTTPAGVEMTDQTWSASFTYSGTGVTADNLSWNGTVAEGSTVAFGFNAAVTGDAPRSLPSLRCERAS